MDHDSLRELVLSQEELEDEDRERAAAHLLDCAECRELLATLRRLEREAVVLGELPADPEHPLYRLALAEILAERNSLKALQARLDAETGVGGKR